MKCTSPVFVERHAGHRLVEQKQLGLGDESAGQLDALLKAIGELADDGEPIPLEAERLNDAFHLRSLLAFFATRRRSAKGLLEKVRTCLQGAAGQQVALHAHALEQRDVLERSRDAEMRGHVRAHDIVSRTREREGASVGPVDAVDHVQHRALACPVRADDGADLSLGDLEAHVGNGADAFERERDALDTEQRRRAGDGVAHGDQPTLAISSEVPSADTPLGASVGARSPTMETPSARRSEPRLPPEGVPRRRRLARARARAARGHGAREAAKPRDR